MTKYFISTVAMAGLAAMLVLPGAAAAQNTTQDANHIVIPLTHPTQPATLKVSTLNGSITVKAYNGRDVIIDGGSGSGDNFRHRDLPVPPEAQGMRRLDTGNGINAQEDNNVVTVSTGIFGGSSLTIQVPASTSVSLHTVNGGHIDVDGVNGDINVEDTNGRVTLTNVGGSIVANALNGRVNATITHLDTTKPSSFSSMNGTIDVTLPADVHAHLRLKTVHGNIYMDNDFNFQQTRTPAPEGERESNGMYRVNVDKGIEGNLNGGGPEIRFQNFNGNIYVRKGH